MDQAGIARLGRTPAVFLGPHSVPLGGTMKRTTATFLLVAGLGGCVSPDKSATKPFGQASRGKEVSGVVGPTGEPLYATGQAATKGSTTAKVGTPVSMPGSRGAEIVPVSGTMPAGTTGGVQQAAGFSRIIGSHSHGTTSSCADGSCGEGVATQGSNFVTNPGLGHGHRHPGWGRCGPNGCNDGGPGGGGAPGFYQSPYGPMANGLDVGFARAGIMPVPAMGPYGAVAAVGAFGPGTAGGPLYANQRTSIRFVSPQGMRVAWQSAAGSFSDGTPLEAPARYNFPQGSTYRLKLTSIPNRPGVVYYPTLEVYPATVRTITYLSHNAVPVGFTEEDFDQVRTGNLVVKVIYLPHDAFQDQAAVAGADEVVSTRLEPGVDPIVEANRRGTILAVIRVGNIDLQDPNTPAMDAQPGVANVRVSSAAPAPMASPIASPTTPAVTMTLPNAISPAPTTATTPANIPVASPLRTPAPLPNAVKTPVTASPVSLPALPNVR